MIWTSSCGRIELHLTKDQARTGSHPGPCDDDIAYLRTLPKIKRQLAQVDPDILRCELKDYGAWDADELADHDANLDRVLWIACCDIREELVQ